MLAIWQQQNYFLCAVVLIETGMRLQLPICGQVVWQIKAKTSIVFITLLRLQPTTRQIKYYFSATFYAKNTPLTKISIPIAISTMPPSICALSPSLSPNLRPSITATTLITNVTSAMIHEQSNACHTPSTNSVMAKPVLNASMDVAIAWISNVAKVSLFVSSSSSFFLYRPQAFLCLRTTTAQATRKGLSVWLRQNVPPVCLYTASLPWA